MTSRLSQTTRRSGLTAALLAVAAMALPVAANAASVTPTDVTGNPSCSDINKGWSDLKVDNVPSNTTYSDGTLSVTISNVTGATTFDWAANHSVDAVMVKSATHTYVYTYDPESYGDTLVSGPGKYAISHVDFCYDDGDFTPPGNGGGGDTGGNGGNTGGGGDTGGSTNTTSTPADGQLIAPTIDNGAQPANPDSQLVLGARIGAVRAKLLAAQGCAARSFSARVRGAGIASVVFTVDGKRVKTVVKGGVYTIRVNPMKLKVGVHRIVATVRFDPARHAKARTLRSTFQRCASRFLAPRFTG